ncbi:MAG: zinc metallopeptidase [Gammaproteobacteria bacterium]|nr:zinc metallopeptidase [Gammaproteobacteria bacterium]MBI5617837.1 zinc metallopeptidase [Gammaproteobacteria bacterium]
MRLDDEQESSNVEDRRGMGLPIRGGIGIGTVAVALIASYFLGIDPRTLLGIASQFQGGQPVPAQRAAPVDDEASRFVRKVLHSTETVWAAQFQQRGGTYENPRLVLFTGATATACGTGQTAMGPFYCPRDRQVYIDLAFYQELRDRFHAPGDFAQAYVIAHEVGHHVQNLMGIADKVMAARQRAGDEAKSNALSVRMELQADCLAGVWAAQANESKKILEAGDVEEALAAATAIGDDRLQKQARGYIVPDTFTHGSSQQRVTWFRRGLDSGDMKQCNTFKAAAL